MKDLKNDIILLHQLENIIVDNIEKSKVYPKLLYVWDLNTKLLEDYKSFRNIGLKPMLARGLLAEIMCSYVIKHWANEKGVNYKIFSNLLIPRIDGGTTQLDLVVITNDFAISVECKSLYGRLNISNGVIKTNKISLSPWKQNMGHIVSLKKVLEPHNLYFHNMVYIFSFGSINEYTPAQDEKLMVNVNSFNILDEILKDSKSYHYKRLSDSELDSIENTLHDYIPTVTQEVDHVRFIEETLRDKQQEV